jgi:hypothetical protein
MYVCMYVCAYVHMYVCVCIYDLCIHVCGHVCVRVRACMRMHEYEWVIWCMCMGGWMDGCVMFTIWTCYCNQLNSCCRASTGSVPPRGIPSHLLACPNTRGAEESSEADSDSSGGPPQPHPPPIADTRPLENNARYWCIHVHFSFVDCHGQACQ